MRRPALSRITIAAALLAALTLVAVACGGSATETPEVADVAASTEPVAAGAGEEPASSDQPAKSEQPATAEQSAGAAGQQPADVQEAMVDYTRCMRENGIDMPDPAPVEGDSSGAFIGAPVDVDPKKMAKADAACNHHLAAFVQEPSPEQEEQIREQGVALARCMREAGFDMPDPIADDGGVVMQPFPDGVDPESTRFREALERCSKETGGPGFFGVGG